MVSCLHYTYKIFLLEVYLEEMSTGDVLGCNDNYIITLLLRPVAIGRYYFLKGITSWKVLLLKRYYFLEGITSYTISAKTTKLQVHKICVNSVNICSVGVLQLSL